MRVLCFGDSITQGFTDPDGGWVHYLWKPYLEKLNDSVDELRPDFFNLGVSADTSTNVCARFEAETAVRKRRHELVFVFAIGVNDACIDNGKPLGTPGQYRQNILQLISMAQKFGPKILFVGLTPCDESKTNPCAWGDYVYKNEDIRRLEAVLVEVCKQQNVAFVPVMDSFVGREQDLLPDGLHPNTEGHRLIADLVRPALNALIK